MLVGKSIILRSLKQEDIHKTHKWRNDFELIKLTQGIRFPKTLEMDKEWFDNVLNDKSNRNIYFGIDEISTNEFVGIVQLNNVDYISGTAVLGFVIGDLNSRGKGYGLELLNLILKYAFCTLNIKKITTYNAAYNQNTFLLQKKVGFIQEGCLVKQIYHDDDFHDVIILSLFKNTYILNNA